MKCQTPVSSFFSDIKVRYLSGGSLFGCCEGVTSVRNSIKCPEYACLLAILFALHLRVDSDKQMGHI